jgi:uncharacterized protein YecE (DUF72 family)
MAELSIGTSAFTAAGWPSTFYPKGLPEREYLSYYATRFDTVEVDSTFYRTPALSTVQGWNAKTPKGFIFATKVPQTITHQKVLRDCDVDLTQFLKVMDALGEKLGPLLFQFGYFNKKAFLGVNDFLARLVPFLKKLPKGYKFCVEIRNRNWLVPQFVDVLRSRGVALALIDQSWMPRPAEWFDRFDPITADFSYVRLLGDRKGIEAKTKTWDKVIVDRGAELSDWAKLCKPIVRRGVKLYAYVNNHYSGCGFVTAEQFRELLDGATEGGRAAGSKPETGKLFD